MTSDETLKDMLEARIAATEEHARCDPDHFEGDEWWQLTGEEKAVFQIERKRWPRMMETWHCYEVFIERAFGSAWWSEADALLASERGKRPELINLGFTFEGFADFAKDYGSLTHREAHAMFEKQTFWEVRCGVMVFRDEQDNDLIGEDA